MYIEAEDFFGKRFVSIDLERAGGEDGDDVTSILFQDKDGVRYRMEHMQDCCEYVWVQEIHGDIEDLIQSPILMAEEVVKVDPNASESATWTFYKFATVKGYVTIRWRGESNGYYSESVDIRELGESDV